MLRFEHLLIVTYGRSGSTLLQGVLNSIDGVLIRGENYHAFHALFTAYRRLKQAKEDFSDARLPTHAWFGAPEIDLAQFLKDAGTLIGNVMRGNREDIRCIGFKEIRYVDTIGENAEYLQFLRAALPRCAVMICSRDLNAVLASSWWRDTDQDTTRSRLEALEAELSDYASQNPDHAFWIDYSDVVENGPRLKEAFDFIGADYDEGVIKDVLKVRHSRQRGPQTLFEPYVKAVYPKDLQQLAVAKIYKLPGLARVGEPFTITGCALAKSSDDPIVDVFAEWEGRTRFAEIGLKSPKVAQEFSERVDASRARFRISGVSVTGATAIVVRVRFASGSKAMIATIKVAPHRQQLCANG